LVEKFPAILEILPQVLRGGGFFLTHTVVNINVAERACNHNGKSYDVPRTVASQTAVAIVASIYSKHHSN